MKSRTSFPVRKAVACIAMYPFTQVREKLLKEGKVAPNVVDEAISEFRKYLTLIALGHKSVGMTSREVDEVWHTFIIFTRDYAVFCQETFGGFLHHQPASATRPLGTESRDRFVDAYHAEFGEVPKIWGINADCSPDTGGGGNECSPVPACDGAPDPSIYSNAASAS